MKSWASNAGLKLLALLLAFTLWFVVSAPRRESVIERAYAVPLTLVGMPRDLVITTPVPDSVSVRLRGRTSDLRSLSSSNLEVPLDLRTLVPGTIAITIRPQAINVPPGVEVVSLDPANVTFRAEEVRQKIVPIRPFLVGDPPAGYTVGDATLNPDHALISGPASQIRGVSEVATERVIMTGRTASFVQNVAVVSDSSLVRVIEPLMTEITVPVTETVGPIVPETDTTATTGTTKSGKNESSVRH
ncbi:MAG TPA: CdaR family protein [Thermoanaerobaculia bacterium]|nr:CdaR family protein [Thermoanaerobaculia bacterium]